eukprot:5105421-Pyramimonas_sp.AAC.1
MRENAIAKASGPLFVSCLRPRMLRDPEPPRRVTLGDGRTCVAIAISQADYCMRIVRDWEAAIGSSDRPAATPAQQTPPPRADDLPPAEAGAGRR